MEFAVPVARSLSGRGQGIVIIVVELIARDSESAKHSFQKFSSLRVNPFLVISMESAFALPCCIRQTILRVLLVTARVKIGMSCDPLICIVRTLFRFGSDLLMRDEEWDRATTTS
jgi:hypothetical protein